MKLAIMQPYFFPYIGYFQLIHAVDKFIILDDVNYINRGWINRNKIIINGEAKWFTLSLDKASQNKLIKEINISSKDVFHEKLLKTLKIFYGKAPYFNQVYDLLNKLFKIENYNLSSFFIS